MSRDISAELKELRLHGMSQAWDEVSAQEGGTHVGVQTGQWLIDHLLQAEHAHRAFVSVRHQMKAAKFPLHRDLAGFDFKGGQGRSKAGQAIEHVVVHRHGAKRRTHWRAGHWQDTSDHGHWGGGHCRKRQTSTLLFDGRSGQ